MKTAFCKSAASILATVLGIGILTGCGGAQMSSGSAASTGAPVAAASDPVTPTTPTTDGGKLEFVLATNTSEDSVNHLLVAKFKELVESKSDGRMVIQMYENGQLGGDREITEGVIAGNIDFIIGMTGSLVDFIPETAIFDMPNIFPDVQTARKVLDGEILGKLQTAYAKSGIKLFAYADSGFRIMTSNKKIASTNDFSGIKIRTMENKNHISYWQKLGSNPTPMDFGEVYIGLQQGTIDASENPYDLIVASKMYEPQKYIVETNHLLHTLNMVMNSKRFDGLSADDQSLISACAVEAHQYARQMADERIVSRKKIITDYGSEIVELSDELRGQMAEKAQGVYDEIAQQTDAELVSLLKSEAEKAKS